MEEYVTLSLERYDSLRNTVVAANELTKELTEKIENLVKEKEKIAKLAVERQQELKELFLNESIRTWQFKDTPLEELIDISSYKCAISNVDTMLEYDFSEDEIINFIKKKYKEWEDAQ